MQTGNLDGQGIAELRGYKFQNLNSAPTTNLYEGRFYYNTVDHVLYVYNGTQWIDALSQGRVYLAGTGIDSTALSNGTIQVSTTVASKTDIGAGNTTIQRNGSTLGTINANQTASNTINISVPTTATEVGALPDSTVIGDGKVIFQKNGTSISTVSANQTSTTTVNFTIPTTAADVGALPSSTVIGDADITIQRNGTAIGTINANQTTAGTINISVPTSASDVGALPSDTVIGDGKTIFKKNGTAFATVTANQTSTVNVNYTIPTQASDINALPSSTTITDLASTTQMSAINSGVNSTIVAQVGTNASNISDIEGLIPSQATTSNQLADKNFVNSSVQTATANFRGNWANWAAVPTSSSDYPEDYAGSKVPTVNDYLVVQDASGYTGETLEGTWRFKYTGDWSTDGKSGWLPEYQVNETPLTAAQLAAINSGVTSTVVTQVGTNATNISGLQTSKQDKLTQGANITISGNTISATDTTYTNGTGLNLSGTTFSVDFTEVATAAQGSKADSALQSIPIAGTSTLGGVKVGSNLTIASDGTLAAVTQSITVDSTLSTSSTNPVQNKVVTSALAAKSSVTFVDWTV